MLLAALKDAEDIECVVASATPAGCDNAWECEAELWSTSAYTLRAYNSIEDDAAEVACDLLVTTASSRLSVVGTSGVEVTRSGVAFEVLSSSVHVRACRALPDLRPNVARSIPIRERVGSASITKLGKAHGGNDATERL